ncbi:MAG TPA: LuxR C-terminal-related transcriptional regulator [Phycisphaerae bacterium]|nr:LuxR C-terminal-related transcriptional regulator [Phycisphaerae bacterium]
MARHQGVGSRPTPTPLTDPSFSPAELARITEALRLTNRQSAVLEHLLQAKGDKQIAASVGITIATVRMHLRHMYLKHGLNDRAGLILRAFAVLRSRSQGHSA